MQMLLNGNVSFSCSAEIVAEPGLKSMKSFH